MASSSPMSNSQKWQYSVFLLCWLPLLAATRSLAREWCRAVPEQGKLEYGVCVPPEFATARYTVEVVSVVGPGVNLRSDVSLVIAGSNGRHTKPIKISSLATGTQKRIHSERVDVGDPEFVHLTLGSTKPWRCERITIWKDFRYWVFGCNGQLDFQSPEASYLLAGNKKYVISVQTGADPHAGTIGSIEVKFVGISRSTNPQTILQAPEVGSNKRVRVRAADVGDLQAIVLANTAEDDPWYCDYLNVRTEDGSMFAFKVKRWIGKPYEQFVLVPLKPSDVDMPSQDVDCYTRAADIFNTTPLGMEVVKVRCPQNCQASEFARVLGSTIHPSISSVCAAAVNDGVLSPSGGEVVVAIVDSLPSYSGLSYAGIDAGDFHRSPEKAEFSYYVYQSDSIDAIEKDVRLVNEYGKLSSTGRLEVRRNGSWGTVCTKGDFARFSVEAAIKACQLMGYKHGVYLEDGCSSVEGVDMCADKGYPVALAGLMCSGPEASIDECTFEQPTAQCEDHTNDIALKCTNTPAGAEPPVGTLRIVDTTGAPSLTGIGRLEFYADGFGSVCGEGWTKESEQVACRQMGYSGVKHGGYSGNGCSDIMGVNYCGQQQEKIATVNVACKGDESELRLCPHLVSDDIYCAHEEDIVVGCEGKGDPSGIGLFTIEEKPDLGVLPIKSVALTCSDRPVTRRDMAGGPGTIFIASCPDGCSEAPGAVKGTFVYTDDSPICKAAIHAGALEASGGDIVVQIGHPQKSYESTDQYNVHSDPSGPHPRSFVTSKVALELRARAGQQTQKKRSEATSIPVVPQPRFSEVESSSQSQLLEDKFHWYPPQGFSGFEGRPGSFVDASYLPGANLVPGFRDFTLTAKVTVTGKKGQWRAIVSDGDCEGFILAIDNNDELVFEQACHPRLIRSGFKPALGEPFDVAVTYFAPERAVGIFVNGRKRTYQKTDYTFNLKPKIMIGRASATESDYFMGEITSVHLFDYVLSPAQIAQLRKEVGPAPEPGRVPRGLRRTEDGRVCISPCSPQEPFLTGDGRPPTNAPLQLRCEDTLLRPEFSGVTGHQILVSCPADCAHSTGPLHGCKIYSADSSICKAALHMGAIQRHGGEAVFTLHDGMPSYAASRGHYGVLSIATNTPQVLSFSVTSAPHYRALTCADNGSFVLKLGIGERELVICPPHCSAVSNRAVYGAGFYSPISSVCRAAIHAGALTDEGGEVEIEAGPPHEAFVGSEGFGITSQKSGSYLRSFAFVTKLSQQEL
uniref:SR1 n=1 Tax=Toxoplasma gondii TaxID=5811 RepID=Q3S622_TOXGO|nr:SR1 [Toxoplasma gondii]